MQLVVCGRSSCPGGEGVGVEGALRCGFRFNSVVSLWCVFVWVLTLLTWLDSGMASMGGFHGGWFGDFNGNFQHEEGNFQHEETRRRRMFRCGARRRLRDTSSTLRIEKNVGARRRLRGSSSTLRIEMNVDKLEKNVDRLEKNVDRIEKNVDKISSLLHRVATDVEKLQLDTTFLKGNQQKVEHKLEELVSDNASFKSTARDIQQSLAVQKKDINSVQGTVNFFSVLNFVSSSILGMAGISDEPLIWRKFHQNSQELVQDVKEDLNLLVKQDLY
ncbi:hypothetical protein M758_7G053800 [Ceratodon purpureus]|nr:hypothetical protein M758_7G053800 [Ceratodon purpureus]